MEHNQLTLEEDIQLINNILDDIDMRYIILFLYVIRNDLLKDLGDEILIDSYNKILALDEIYKSNITSIWDEDFTEIYIDLGLMKNIRSKREFDQKDDDFIIKLGVETITIEQNTISVPDDSLFLILKKKFKNLTRRNFNLSLTRLKGVRCERSDIIHSLIFEIGEHDYSLSDDLFYILDQFGNIFQAIKIEITIEGFYSRFKEILEKINNYTRIFDPILNSKSVIKKINKAMENKKKIIQFLKDEKVELSDKFKFNKINKENSLYHQWRSSLVHLLELRYQLAHIEKKIVDIKSYYSGKKKKFKYLKFIEGITFNEDDILDNIQYSLVELRKKLIKINEELSKVTLKEIKLLNLDYERLIITSSDE